MLKANRLKSVIEKDRLIISDEVIKLIEYDLNNLLANYFNLDNKAELEMQATKSNYEITIKCTANSVKPFGIIK